MNMYRMTQMNTVATEMSKIQITRGVKGSEVEY